MRRSLLCLLLLVGALFCFGMAYAIYERGQRTVVSVSTGERVTRIPQLHSAAYCDFMFNPRMPPQVHGTIRAGVGTIRTFAQQVLCFETAKEQALVRPQMTRMCRQEHLVCWQKRIR
jgi:hypothetical protein